VIVAVKDSSGDWRQTERFLEVHSDLAILVGGQRHLARTMTLSGAGTICGIANLAPDAIGAIVHAGGDDERVCRLIEEIVTLPIMAAIKTLIGRECRRH
jgi:4-hydroxy-tetrahydrodipicolinate synthase